jgi:murein DD-endopeptidase MepM/ murein hydrolase activator NlpD
VTQELPTRESPPREPAAGARVAAVEPLPTAAAEPAGAAVQASIAAPPPAPSAPSFAWPLRGAIVSAFGSKKGGEHNDGINIAAGRGAPVRAAGDGTVAYAGNELRGFGNLVLIRHADGWTTAYAHNETLLVKRGDRVARGQVIARAGSTGSVATPQLHFEIRRGRRAVDPAEYLATAAGPSVSLTPVADRDGRRGPE